MRISALILLSGLLCLASASSYAEEEPRLRLSGFGTLSLAHSTNDEADYRSNLYQGIGPGRSHEYDRGMDSKLGLQLAYEINPQWSAVAQVVADRNYDNRFTPELEWANVKWQFNEQGYLRLGRIVAPVFMNSETIHVGYSQTMLRNPPDVYIQNPVNNLDGLDFGYDWELGAVRLNARYNFGFYSNKIQTRLAQSDLDLKAHILSATLEYNYWTTRFAYMRIGLDQKGAVFNQYLTTLDNLAAASVPNAQFLKDHVHFTGVTVNFSDVGVMYDNPNAFLFQGEYIARRFNSLSNPDTQGWYLMGGYHFGALTPFIAYSRCHMLDDLALPNIDVANTPTNLQAGASYVNAINTSLKRAIDRQTLSVGARYALGKNLDLKMQWDHISKPADSIGFFLNTTGSFTATPQTTNIFSVALDFVF